MHILCTVNGETHDLPATEEWSIMEIIREGGVSMLAQCGGSCACATCHIYVKSPWKEILPDPGEEEIGMLDGAFEVTEDSRLACQIFFTTELDGLEVTVAKESME